MRAPTFSFALSALSVVAAQQTSNFTIDPNSVDLGTRSSWCVAERNHCKTLCGSEPDANKCDPNTLDFSCTCSNGTAPGLQYYTGTMPTFFCEKSYQDCINAHPNDAQAQSGCKLNIEINCGRLDPDKVAGSQSSPSSAATATASGTFLANVPAASNGANPTSASKPASSNVASANVALIGYAVAAAAGVLTMTL